MPAKVISDSTGRAAHGAEFDNPAHGHPLCTLHGAEGLYTAGSDARGICTKVNQVYSPAKQAGLLYTRGPLYPNNHRLQVFF